MSIKKDGYNRSLPLIGRYMTDDGTTTGESNHILNYETEVDDGVVLEVVEPTTADVDEQWFYKATNNLYKMTVTNDGGTVTDIVKPDTAVTTGDKWFDVDTSTIYIVTLASDAGVEVPVIEPAEVALTSPVVGDQWFDESINTLITCAIDYQWAGATTEVLAVAEPTTADLDEQWFDETGDKLYNMTITNDAGTVLVLEHPTTSVTTGDEWFSVSLEKLYVVTLASDGGTIFAVEPIPGANVGQQYFDKATDTLYTYVASASQDSYIEVQTGEALMINEINVVIEDNASLNLGGYGSDITIVAGIKFFVQRSDGDKDYLNEISIINNTDYNKLGDVEYLVSSAANFMLSATIVLDDLELTVGDKIGIELDDDFTGLVSHYFTCNGQRFILS